MKVFTKISALICGVIFSSNLSAQWVELDLGSDRNIDQVEFIDASNGYLIAKSGLGSAGYGGVYKTTDAGSSWSNVFVLDNSDPNNFTSISVVDANTCFASQYSGDILRTLDGGTSWDTLVTGLNNYIIDLYFLDINIGFATADFGIVIRTTDGGTTWSTTTLIAPDYLSAIQFTDATTGYIVGTSGMPGATGTIYKTTDAGANWSDISPSLNYSHLNNLSFVDNNTGFAVGSVGYILKTTDGGMNWNMTNSGTVNHLFGVSFFDSQNGMAAGDNGTIVKTTDGGDTWTDVSYDPNWLNSVAYVDVNTAFVVGYDGLILTLDSPTAVNNLKAGSQLDVYPNPAINELTIALQNEDQVIEIVDITGKILISLKIDSATTIEISKLKRGVYFVRCKHKNSIAIKKFVKE